MAHAVAGVAKRCQALPARDVQSPRPCLLRVSAPRLEQVEPSPPDEFPVTRARYAAFAPPATRVVAKDTSRTTYPSLRGTHPSPQLHVAEGPLQRSTPLTDRQLEEFSASVLSSSSSVWSAEARNLPASTSDSNPSLDEVLAQVKGKGRLTIVAALNALTKRGELDAVVRVLQECSKPTLEGVCRSWHYKDFVAAVGFSQKAKPAIQFAKLAAPHVQKPAVLLTAVLQTCAKCRDLDAGMAVVDLAQKHSLTVDAQMLTTLIKVCKAVGNVDKAYRVYLEMRTARHQIDSHVYGALIATCAEAMKRDLTVVHERKDQFVLLERAFHYVADAEAAGVALQAPVWNALMVCAGRSGELNRAFEVLTMMQQRGISASATTYGSLIESCVCARQAEKALRVFEVAMQKGFVSEVKLYTQALSACMLPFPGAWERAGEIYNALQRASVRPDKKFFACLMAVAGRCGRLDTAFELLSEMAAEGIRPSGSSVSAIIHACLDRGNLPLARRVYDLCARQGVYPVPSQFNRMMDVYASEFRFGEVVSLLCDMVAAGRQPNLNTYRIIINACAFTDQAGLAFQIFALMHANKVQILQAKFAQTIYYMLVKSCLNQTRFLWTAGGYPPNAPSDGAATTSGGGAHSHHGLSMPTDRRQEAEKVLAALGGHKLRRGAHQSNPFDGPPDTVDWASHALSAFHHMLSRGFRPSLELLDTLLSCMRAKMMPADDGSLESHGLAGQQTQPMGGAGAAQYISPFVPLRPRNEVFEAAFEPRAFAVLEEAIGRGLLPPYDPDAPLVMDMRRLPPVVAEVYVLHMLFTLERRARRKKAEKAEAAGVAGVGPPSYPHSQSYHHSITLLVPAFDPDLVKFPSYLDRTMNRYTAMMSPEERAKLRHRSDRRRSRAGRRGTNAAAAALAAAAPRPAFDMDGSEDDQGRRRDSGAAVSSYDELEAVIGGEDGEGVDADPWQREDAHGWSSSGEESDDDGAAGADLSGGSYMADCTTGLAVAATLQRMKVWMDMDYAHGTITVFAVEVARWLKRRRQAAEEAAAVVGGGAAAAAEAEGPPAASHNLPSSGVTGPAMMGGIAGGARMMGLGGPMGRAASGSPVTPVEQQQRNIRLGMMGPASGGPVGRGGGGIGPGGPPQSAIDAGFGAPGPGLQQSPPGRSVGSLFGDTNGAASRSRPTTPHSIPPRSSQRPDSAPEAASGAAPEAPGATAAAATFQSLAARLPSPSRNSSEPQPLLNRPGELRLRLGPTAPGEVAAGPVDSVAVNGHYVAPLRHVANGSSEVYAGQGGGQQQHRRSSGGSTESLLIAVPQQQHVEVTVGPGLPVKLPLTEPAAIATATAASA